MTDLERANIALGVWKPGQRCTWGPGKTPCVHGSEVDHIIEPQDPHDPAVFVAWLDLLVAERDVEVVEDDEKYIMPERLYAPELWFKDGLWYFRTNGWDETYRAPDPADALIAACAALWSE